MAEPTDKPDLQTQLETLFDVVWREEIGWRFDDRIDLALGRPERPPQEPK